MVLATSSPAGTEPCLWRGRREAGGVSALKHAAVMTDLSGAKTPVKQRLPRKGKKKGRGGGGVR